MLEFFDSQFEITLSGGRFVIHVCLFLKCSLNGWMWHW